MRGRGAVLTLRSSPLTRSVPNTSKMMRGVFPRKRGRPRSRSIATPSPPVSPEPAAVIATPPSPPSPVPDFPPCQVSLKRMNFDAWFEENPKARGDTTPDVEIADSRLGKQENGMVLIPRTFYNRHPAKMVVPQRRQSIRSSEGLKKSPIKKSGLDNGFDSNCFEYRLVLYPPTVEPSPGPPSDFSLEILSNQVDDEKLPSQMWEVERIPPPSDTTVKADGYDSIAAELEAIMGGDQKKEDDDALVKIDTEEDKSIPMELCTLVEPTKPEAEKEHDEYPSIMEMLNEIPTPAKENVDVVEDINKMETETEDDKKPEDTKQTKDDGQDQEPKVEKQTDADEIKLETDQTKPELVVEDVKKTNNNEYMLNSIIFRRYTADKLTYDRLVTFHQNMEYFISVDDKKIELLGAPEFVANVEDLQILLQIVDSVDLNSFNVLLKS